MAALAAAVLAGTPEDAGGQGVANSSGVPEELPPGRVDCGGHQDLPAGGYQDRPIVITESERNSPATLSRARCRAMLLCRVNGSADFSWFFVGGSALAAGLRTRQGRAARGGQALIRSPLFSRQAEPGTADESFAGQHGCGSRILGQAVPGACALVSGRAEVRVDLAGDVTLEAADDFRFRLSFCCAALDVGAGGRVRAQAGEHDPPQRVVCLPGRRRG
jgi:hypothetical protein